MNPKSIAFHHFGCKVNFAEASTLSRQFQEKGLVLKDFHDQADIYVISTCMVTAVAEKKCRAAIRQAHKLNPKAKIAVIGCFSELKPQELAEMEGVDLVLGHTGKFNLMDELEKLETVHDYHGGIYPGETESRNTFIPSYSYGDRTRSFLKIQDGCDYFCTYCTIPLARGRSRSDSIENILKNAKEIASHGIKEIVLTGVNIGDFGRHSGESLLELIRSLDRIEGIPRLRISSIEPDLLSDEIIELISTSDHFMPHFHIPLQSGSDRVLKAMHRKYKRDLYQSRVKKIRSIMPYSCIAADIIAGFPGETEDDFRDALAFIRGLDISYLHVFTYSKRENTLASKMEGMIPDKIKKERSEMLHSLSEEQKRLFYIKNTGRDVNVLFESANSQGFMHGFSENYLKVKTPFTPELINRITTVRLDEMDEDGVFMG
jgi:threonylcarbamoyladenosine tRNA methylthiotransferase MtaB